MKLVAGTQPTCHSICEEGCSPEREVQGPQVWLRASSPGRKGRIGIPLDLPPFLAAPSPRGKGEKAVTQTPPEARCPLGVPALDRKCTSAQGVRPLSTHGQCTSTYCVPRPPET